MDNSAQQKPVHTEVPPEQTASQHIIYPPATTAAPTTSPAFISEPLSRGLLPKWAWWALIFIFVIFPLLVVLAAIAQSGSGSFEAGFSYIWAFFALLTSVPSLAILWVIDRKLKRNRSNLSKINSAQPTIAAEEFAKNEANFLLKAGIAIFVFSIAMSSLIFFPSLLESELINILFLFSGAFGLLSMFLTVVTVMQFIKNKKYRKKLGAAIILCSSVMWLIIPVNLILGDTQNVYTEETTTKVSKLDFTIYTPKPESGFIVVTHNSAAVNDDVLKITIQDKVRAKDDKYNYVFYLNMTRADQYNKIPPQTGICSGSGTGNNECSLYATSSGGNDIYKHAEVSYGSPSNSYYFQKGNTYFSFVDQSDSFLSKDDIKNFVDNLQPTTTDQLKNIFKTK